MMDNTQDGESIWAEFAGNSRGGPSTPSLKRYISGKTLLITGAGGSIGSALARFATTTQTRRL